MRKTSQSIFYFIASLVSAVSIQVSMSSNSWAAEIAGVKFEDNTKLEDTPLVLNGLGLRKFAFFKVYAGALYLKEKSTSDQKILSSNEPKMIKMHFLRDVSSKDIQKAWTEGYNKNCMKDECDLFKNEVIELNKLMKDCKEGDTLQFDFTQKSLKLAHNGAPLGNVEKEGFSKSILAIFLGKNPPNEALKTGLLGL
jgi:hypothetical protein